MVEANIVTVYESTEPPNTSFLYDPRQKDFVAASLCTVTLWVRTGESPVSLMTRPHHVHALSSSSTMQNSLESMAHVLLVTGVVEMTYVTWYYIKEGRQPMVSRLRMLYLSLVIMSTVMGVQRLRRQWPRSARPWRLQLPQPSRRLQRLLPQTSHL